MNYSLNANIVYGVNALDQLPALAPQYGKKACIVMDPFFLGKPLEARIRNLLAQAGVGAAVYSGFTPDPDSTEVDQCVAFLQEAGCDFVIAVGGGSCIDTAKLAGVTAFNGGKAWDYCVQKLPNGKYGYKDIPKGSLPLIAIATTSGTGSEANGGAVISNREIGFKSGLVSPYMFPKTSIVDPVLVAGLPPKQTAYTGFDVFSHAFESYMLPGFSTYFSEMTALESMRLFALGFVRAVQDGNDLEAREWMANASTLAGMNIAMTDTSVGHILAAPLSVYHHMPHGATLVVLMDAIVDWLVPAAPERLARVADVLAPDTVAGWSQQQKAEYVPVLLREMKKQAGIDLKMRDFGVVEEEIPTFMEYVQEHAGVDCAAFKAFARVPTWDDLVNIYKNSL